MASRRGEQKLIPKTFRVTATCDYLWDYMAAEMGLSLAAVLETAIRRLAKEEGVVVPGAEELEQARGVKRQRAEDRKKAQGPE